MPQTAFACASLLLAACAGGRMGAGTGLSGDDASRWVEETLSSLTLREAVAQLVFPWISGGYAAESDPELKELLAWVEEGLGGVLISIGVPDAYAAKLNRLQARASVPLLVASDFENGGPGMRINHSYAIPSLLPQGGGTSFPPTMAFGAAGDEELAFEYGRVTATEARAVGVHWLLAPVLDVNSNPENPVINTRSFGEHPETVGRLGAAFIRGAQAGGALVTAKHFPGHGDTRTDSHIELPVVAADRERLDRVELVPFRMAVEAGVDAVMTAHVAVPEVLGDERPATMSPVFMDELLRGEMGFGGILFTDALRMGAITDGYGAGEAAVLALEAGSDVLLAPDGVHTAIDAVVAAVGSGRLSRSRIDRSVRRLLEAKARLGLHRGALVDPARVAAVVGAAPHRDAAARAAEASVTLVRDSLRALPLRASASVLSVTYARSRDLLAGRTFDAALRSHLPSRTASGGSRAASFAGARIGPETAWPVYDSLLHLARGFDAVIVSAYVPPVSGSGTIGLPPAPRAFVERLRRLGRGAEAAIGAAPAMAGPSVVLISFGSPYLISALPGVDTYLVAWGGREVSQLAAARAVAGAAGVRGRLPISIPPLYERGAGLDREAVARARAGDEPGDRPDPLREAGFLPGGEDGAGADTLDRATGGPGRWRGTAEIPLCGEDEIPGGAATLADHFCRIGHAVVSPREADARQLGMSPDSLDALDEHIVGALADSAASGAALAIIRRGRLARLRAYGRLDWDPAAPPVTPASLFDLASLTKVVGTTSAVVILAQRGLLELDDPVAEHLPWWEGGDPAKARVTTGDLLYHRAGLPSYRPFFLEAEGRVEYTDAIGALPLAHPPGEHTRYSDIGPMVVAFVVEAVSGMAFDDFLEAEIWRPLGMGDTGFLPDSSLWDRVATTELDEGFRGMHVHGVPHDENAYAIGGVAGHAGLFGSARDLAVFAQTILDRGVAAPCTPDRDSGAPCHLTRFGPVVLFAQGWIDRIAHREDPGSSRTLGWDTPSGCSSAGDYLSARSIGHTGFTGTSLWIDPEQDLAVVLLTNRVNPSRENRRHIELRREVHDRVARAIVDTPPRVREGAQEDDTCKR
ncbi:MAG: serine hydrolase [Gemmatimonadetes bacterium]|nr:serine hydrolase [Gemmatimonadota bacterium]MCY3943921.1 serine hydrolase [Gemmatimonadota bacterium]